MFSQKKFYAENPLISHHPCLALSVPLADRIRAIP